MICTLAALCLLNPVQETQDTLHWPLVPGPQFALNGINPSGTATIGHIAITVSSPAKQVQDAKGESADVTVPTGSSEWKTLQLVFTYTKDGTLAKFGGISLVAKNGKLWFAKQGRLSEIAPIAQGDLNDVQIVKHFDSVVPFVNGSKTVATIVPTAPLFPVHVGLDGWKGSVIAAATYGRELTIDELFANEQAAKSISKALFGDTPKVTVEAELTAMTPIPELEHIRPYRSALLAEEYKLVRIVSGRQSSFKLGMKLRIFRYGIRAGEKTEMKNAKLGDHQTMLIQAYDSDPKFGREFQVDNLDPDFSIPQFVDVTPVN